MDDESTAANSHQTGDAMNESENHQLIVGGVTLVSDGKVATVTSPVCVYQHFTPDHVNSFWAWARATPQFAKIFDNFRNDLSALLIEWGRQRASSSKEFPDS